MKLSFRAYVIVLVVLKVVLVSEVSQTAFCYTRSAPELLLFLLASCPNRCGDHGKCISIANLFTFYTPYSTGAFESWEGEQVTTCVCDPGFTGHACEMSKCTV